MEVKRLCLDEENSNRALVKKFQDELDAFFLDPNPVCNRTLITKRFMTRIQEIKNLEGNEIDDEFSFYGDWPNDLRVIPVDPLDPCPGMLKRVKRFRKYMAREFKNCTGVYVGQTRDVSSRFKNVKDDKRRENEVAVMLVLHDFPDEIQSTKAEHQLNDLIFLGEIPVYDREKRYKARIPKPGPASVYVLLFVSK